MSIHLSFYKNQMSLLSFLHIKSGGHISQTFYRMQIECKYNYITMK